MTDAELLAIEARAKAATAGPWYAHPEENSADDEDPAGRIACISTGAYRWSGEVIVECDSGVYPPNPPDAAFIAHAREDVPALVAEVRRLRAEVAAARDEAAPAVVP